MCCSVLMTAYPVFVRKQFQINQPVKEYFYLLFIISERQLWQRQT